MIPDLCTVNIDIRLTPAPDDPVAVALLQEAAASSDSACPDTRRPMSISPTRWPPYALPDNSPLRDALPKGATRAGMAPVAKVAGPSTLRGDSPYHFSIILVGSQSRLFAALIDLVVGLRDKHRSP
jgi:succinyl-diaminopimelate desuccinylase